MFKERAPNRRTARHSSTPLPPALRLLLCPPGANLSQSDSRPPNKYPPSPPSHRMDDAALHPQFIYPLPLRLLKRASRSSTSGGAAAHHDIAAGSAYHTAPQTDTAWP
jgi:hypothetical protein